MKTHQENDIRTSYHPVPVPRVIDRDLIDRDFDQLRARAWERSIWAVRMHRVQEIVTTGMAIVMGSLMGWTLMR